MALDDAVGAREATGLLVENKVQGEASVLSTQQPEDESAAPNTVRFESEVVDITDDGATTPSGIMFVVALGGPASMSLPSIHLMLPSSQMLPLPRW